MIPEKTCGHILDESSIFNALFMPLRKTFSFVSSGAQQRMNKSSNIEYSVMPVPIRLMTKIVWTVSKKACSKNSGPDRKIYCSGMRIWEMTPDSHQNLTWWVEENNSWTGLQCFYRSTPNKTHSTKWNWDELAHNWTWNLRNTGLCNKSGSNHIEFVFKFF